MLVIAAYLAGGAVLPAHRVPRADARALGALAAVRADVRRRRRCRRCCSTTRCASLLTPLVVAVVVEARLPALPYLLALASAANVGGVVSFSGNPQNMIVGAAAHGTIGFAQYLAAHAARRRRRASRRTRRVIVLAVPRTSCRAGRSSIARRHARRSIARSRRRRSVALALFAGLALAGVSLAGAAMCAAAGADARRAHAAAEGVRARRLAAARVLRGPVRRRRGHRARGRARASCSTRSRRWSRAAISPATSRSSRSSSSRRTSCRTCRSCSSRSAGSRSMPDPTWGYIMLAVALDARRQPDAVRQRREHHRDGGRGAARRDRVLAVPALRRR